MIKVAVHVCLVSEQLLPNLLPILDEKNRPQDVVLLVTPKMKGAADRLGRLLVEAGCRIIKKEVRAYRIEDIRDSVVEVIDTFPGKMLALNATGGTKIMALGAYGIFREFDYPAFYIDSENQAVLSLSPSLQSSPLPDVLKIGSCLKCYGYKIVSFGKPELQLENRQLYQSLVDNIELFETAFGQLNYYAGKARQQLWCALDSHVKKDSPLAMLLNLFEAASHLSVSEARLVFQDEAALRLVQGGWLEQYVYGLIEDLRRKKKVRDAAIGMVVQNQRGTKNEIDVACTYANRLHVIECKTANLRSEKTKGDDVVYKLDNLRDLMGGSYGRALLVSYHRLRPEDIQRCQDNDVSVVCGRQLQQLSMNIPRWLKGETLRG